MSETSSQKTAILFIFLFTVAASTIWLWNRPQPEVIDSSLKVQGTKIVDNHGNEIILQGISVSFNDLWRKEGSNDRAEYYHQTYFKEEDVKDMKKHGATHIDLHRIFWSKLMTEDGEINTQYFENWLDHFVDYCEKNKMPYIINIENLGQSSLSGGHYVSPAFINEAMGYSHGWWDEEDAERIYADIIFKFYTSNVREVEQVRQKWFETWKYIANRYKDNKYCIGFSIANEPIHLTRDYRTDDISQEVGIGYSQQIERCIDEIRSTGTKQIIFVDRPYLNSLDHIITVNRSNIIWEAHMYHSMWTQTIEEWKQIVDQHIQRFTVDFHKPIYIGEYGHDPVNFKNDLTTEEIQTSIDEQVNYLKSKSVAGMSFFAWGRLSGRGWADWGYDWYTTEETDYILDAIFS